jgi:hypothetical protein
VCSNRNSFQLIVLVYCTEHEVHILSSSIHKTEMLQYFCRLYTMLFLHRLTPFSPLLLLSWLAATEASLFPCNETWECEDALGLGSMCMNSLCSNTYFNGGCLKSILTDWNKTRICNSQDPAEAEAMGYCRKSSMDYVEIRMGAKNWESANFVSWILQILFSEVLEIPTSIESGFANVNLNFYEKSSSFDTGSVVSSADMAELTLASLVGDCIEVTNINDPEHYQSCAHVYPEIWPTDYPVGYQADGMEPSRDLGLLGENAMFIPLFAVEQDPTLVSYVGLRGEVNRRKVAETFKRPTRWGQYCKEVSLTNCSDPDLIAQRAPLTEDEEASFFQQGTFNGHFRHTEESNCDKYPTSCTGHYVDFQCGWASYAKPQAYHLNIAFSFEGPAPNGGYSYIESVQIWSAANATKSPVALTWWAPEPILESYMGTDAEFTRVLFPTPTQECVDNRYNLSLQCDSDVTLEEKMG